jgi:periplasmic protein TonB
MRTNTASRNEELERRWDRVFRWALVASVLLHILVVILFREQEVLPEVETTAAGERAGDPEAAAGGGMEMIELRVATTPPVAEEAVVEPVPVPDPEPVPEPQPQEEQRRSSQPLGQQASAGEGRGTETGPGTETGTGRGDGGTGEEGLNRGVTAPSPRGMILPPSDRPSRVRGMTVTVYVFVATNGNVVSDSTRIAPSTGDARFDRRLREDAAQWKFRPGTRDGAPIAAWFPYTITF